MRYLQIPLLTAVLLVLQPVSCSQDHFPEWRSGSIGLSGSWEAAPNVVVGDVSNIVALGPQEIANPPWPVPNSVHEIYWCQADFKADAAIKGDLPSSGKKFLWAAIRPGCGFEWFRYGYDEKEAPTTRIWFVREEGEYIRPVVDAGGVFFVSLHGKWFNPPKQEAPRMLALLMLNPAALGMSTAHYSIIFNTPVQLVRTILGDAEMAERLSDLAASTASSDRDLHEAVCYYLKDQLGRSCR
jgi:hypothetical protein